MLAFTLAYSWYLCACVCFLCVKTSFLMKFECEIIICPFLEFLLHVLLHHPQAGPSLASTINLQNIFLYIICIDYIYYHCHIMIYKKYNLVIPMAKYISHIYLVFVHSSWLTTPKTLRISCDLVGREVCSIFCYVNEVIIGKHLGKLRMEAGCQKNQPCGSKIGTLSAPPFPHPQPPGKGERKLCSVTNGQGFNPSCLCYKVSIKNPKRQCSEIVWVGEPREVLHPFPYILPYSSLPSGCS